MIRARAAAGTFRARGGPERGVWGCGREGGVGGGHRRVASRQETRLTEGPPAVRCAHAPMSSRKHSGP